MPSRNVRLGLTLLVFLLGTTASQAADWPRFRGPNGGGVSPDNAPVPAEWSDTKNLKWKVKLPGPGASSPIVVGQRIFVTCWSGYGTDARSPGDLKNLKRHLVCLDRKSGDIIWDKTVDPVLPEDEFRGMFAENGYATHTPVSDGERVYAFFGKSGVLAFDNDGKQLWQAKVGSELDYRGWGSASSPILFKNLVIVTASVESHALVALNKETGEKVWEQEAEGFGSTWGTPVLVELPDGRTDLVIGVPYEIWGLSPDTGKLIWFCDGVPSNSMCSSVVAHDGVVYAADSSGTGGGGTIAVRAGGKGDVTKTHVVWTGRDRSRIGTPMVHDGHLYWVSSKIANCVNIADGKSVFQSRLGSSSGADNQGSQGQSRFGRGGGGGGRGGQDYSSPVCADGKIFYSARSGETFVFKAGPKFELLATNRFADGGQLVATPAISDGELLIRSSTHLYCVAAKP